MVTKFLTKVAQSFGLFLQNNTFKVKTAPGNFLGHLREIDCSSGIVGGQAIAWAMALNPGANQYTGPAFSAKACFMVAGNITTGVNKGGPCQ